MPADVRLPVPIDLQIGGLYSYQRWRARLKIYESHYNCRIQNVNVVFITIELNWTTFSIICYLTCYWLLGELKWLFGWTASKQSYLYYSRIGLTCYNASMLYLWKIDSDDEWCWRINACRVCILLTIYIKSGRSVHGLSVLFCLFCSVRWIIHEGCNSCPECVAVAVVLDVPDVEAPFWLV